MNRELLNIFESLEDQSEDFLFTLQKSIPNANDQIYEAVRDFLSSLQKNRAGGIAQTIGNLTEIDRFRTRLSSIIATSDYGRGVNQFIEGYRENIPLVDSFYTAMVSTYQSNNQMRNLLFREARSLTIDTLLDSGIASNFRDPIIKVLKDNVVSGQSVNNTAKAVRSYMFEGNNTRLDRYVNQVASDAITQFNSNYINLISEDLGLNHYYYKGTKVADSRSFCVSLAGRYFTEDQLKKIVSSRTPWQGMIRGTNWGTFKKYRGGYNCRHYLIPVSKELYDRYSG